MKGYFILGGPRQGISDLEETINFARAAGFDLAYFAIYKDFRGLVKAVDPPQELFNFLVFESRITDCLLMPEDASALLKVFGRELIPRRRKEYAAEYAELAKLGFTFDDIIKYNDFHSESSFYQAFGFASSEEYLSSLSYAYLTFYFQPGWSETYQRLIREGY